MRMKIGKCPLCGERKIVETCGNCGVELGVHDELEAVEKELGMCSPDWSVCADCYEGVFHESFEEIRKVFRDRCEKMCKRVES